MNETRYDMVQEISGTWAIFDNITGTPAEHGERVLIGLEKAEAEALLRTGIGCRISLVAKEPPPPSRA